MNQTQIDGILANIQKKANEKFSNLWTTKKADEDILMVLRKASKKRSLPKWKKDYYKLMIRELDKEETVLDEDVAKQKSEYIDKMIDKEIKLGRLPSKKTIEKQSKKYVQNLSTTDRKSVV